MQIVRFKAGGKTRYGVLEGLSIVEYTGTPFTLFRRGRRRYPLKHAVLLAPVVPSNPIMFLKPTTALIGPDDPIVCPPMSARVEHEAELAVVIKRRCRDVPPARAREYVLAYTCLNDVTARDLQEKDGRGSRAKAFDTFCPIGPSIATDIDPNAVTIEAYVNGEVRQSSSTKEPAGDVIATGTPPGVGPLVPGDRVEVRIEGIGSVKNTVVKL